MHRSFSSSSVGIGKRWQVLRSCFSKIKVEIRGLPAHVWHLSPVQRLHEPACSKLQPTPETIAKTDLHRFVADRWCIHPDLFPCEKIIYVPEPDFVHVYNPPLFLHPEDIIFRDQPMLRYCVFINILEVTDWHDPFSLSGLDPNLFDPRRQPFSRPWPKWTHFDAGSHGGTSTGK
jgi:hypothetical protein